MTRFRLRRLGSGPGTAWPPGATLNACLLDTGYKLGMDSLSSAAQGRIQSAGLRECICWQSGNWLFKQPRWLARWSLSSCSQHFNLPTCLKTGSPNAGWISAKVFGTSYSPNYQHSKCPTLPWCIVVVQTKCIPRLDFNCRGLQSPELLGWGYFSLMRVTDVCYAAKIMMQSIKV